MESRAAKSDERMAQCVAKLSSQALEITALHAANRLLVGTLKNVQIGQPAKSFSTEKPGWRPSPKGASVRGS